MKCNEVQTMQDPYLDSELDAKTTLKIEQHLAACPACARLFALELKLEARISAGLNRGSRTAVLWERIEREVVAGGRESNSFEGCEQGSRGPGARTFLSARSLPVAWRTRMSALLGRAASSSQWAWTGLATVWAVILVLNLAAREPVAPLVAGQEVPSPSEMRLALEQKYLLMSELALTSDPAPADKPKPVRPSPHSERRNETLNA